MVEIETSSLEDNLNLTNATNTTEINTDGHHGTQPYVLLFVFGCYGVGGKSNPYF